jgi:parvulin-like peptidyl-prolyl isomerase
LLGDSTLLPAEIRSSSSFELARIFGAEFVSALTETSVGGWQGPLRSGYGLHLVRIDEHIAAREPVLDEVRAAIVRDVLSDRSQKIGEAFYAALRERYTVRIESVEQND